MNGRIAAVVIGLLLITHLGLLVLAAIYTPWTSDEQGYLFAGMALRNEMHFDVTETIKHGPLPFLANQLGSWIGLPTEATLLATDGNKINGRIGMLLFSLLATLCLARLSLKALGAGTAVVAVALYTLQPLVLGHGCLMTADMALAAGSLLVLLTLFTWLEKGGWLRLVMLSISLGLALATKYLAVLLVPLVILTLLVETTRGFTPHLVLSRRNHKASRRWADLLGSFQVMGLLSLVTLHGCYLFQGGFFGPIGAEIPGQEVIAGGLLERLRDLPLLGSTLALLPGPFVRGIDFQLAAASQYVHTMFWDAVVPGHPGYYALGLLTKLTMPLLLLLGLAVGLRFAPLPAVPPLPRRLQIALPLFLLGPLAYLSFATKLQIGVRYALPAVPLLAMLAARPVPALWKAGILGRALVAIAGLSSVAILGLTWVSPTPRNVDYFHSFADRRPYRLFGDSNLDWQRNPRQDPNLDELRAANPDAVVLNFPSGPRFGKILIHGLSLWPKAAPTAGPVRHWLRELWPTDRSGAWFLFRVDDKVLRATALASKGPRQAHTHLDRAIALFAIGEVDEAKTALRDAGPEPADRVAKVRALLHAQGPTPPRAWMDVGRFDKVLEDPKSNLGLRAESSYRQLDWKGCVQLLAPIEKAGELSQDQVPILVDALERTGKLPRALRVLARHFPTAKHPHYRLYVQRRNRYRRELDEWARLQQQVQGR